MNQEENKSRDNDLQDVALITGQLGVHALCKELFISSPLHPTSGLELGHQLLRNIASHDELLIQASLVVGEARRSECPLVDGLFALLGFLNVQALSHFAELLQLHLA